MKIYLVVLTVGKTSGHVIPIQNTPFFIGRNPDCHLRPRSALVSERHCAVLPGPTGFFVRDFGGTTGTFVNERLIQSEALLRHGDTLRVGPLSFRILIEDLPIARTDDALATLLLATDEPALTGVSAVGLTPAPLEACSTVLTKKPEVKKSPASAQDAALAILAKFRPSR